MVEVWASTIAVRVPLERCPFCEATERVRVRSNKLPDGSVERLRVCKKCSRRYRFIIDAVLSPVSGMFR